MTPMPALSRKPTPAPIAARNPRCRNAGSMPARSIARATRRRSGSNPAPRVPQPPMIAVRNVALVACDPDPCAAVTRRRFGVR
jgi:hypothetical protein